ncbi:hypothetical protein VNO78_31511 [Psophocarpus tetragonolobus]|uniref:Uncharacterized protein n=1 Tax=Psophocarpus tetragonolobus TaxID=3891 RepID=A0AAN9RYC8_PSOTE
MCGKVDRGLNNGGDNVVGILSQHRIGYCEEKEQHIIEFDTNRIDFSEIGGHKRFGVGVHNKGEGLSGLEKMSCKIGKRSCSKGSCLGRIMVLESLVNEDGIFGFVMARHGAIRHLEILSRFEQNHAKNCSNHNIVHR